jgi:hypothetical protein
MAFSSVVVMDFLGMLGHAGQTAAKKAREATRVFFISGCG